MPRLVIPVILVCAFTLASAGEDNDWFAQGEMAALARELKPPARFAAHRPKFSVEKRSFTFEGMDGPYSWEFWVVKDGERHVAVMPFAGFHGGTLYLLTWDPALAPTALPMPTERWHIDTAIGSAIRTDHFLEQKGHDNKLWQATDKEKSEWIPAEDGATLTLVRRFQGPAKMSKWEDKGKYDDLDHTGTFVISVDPIFGYVVDCTWDTWAKPAPDRTQYCSLMPAGLSNPWPGAEPGQRGLISPIGSAGYTSYAMNHVAISKFGGNRGCRDKGIVAYLNQVTGWSPAASLHANDADLAVCNVHADYDLCVRWPKDLPVDDKGRKHFVARVRQCFMPPELTQRVWDKATSAFLDGKIVVLPVGKVEDFEQQPFSIDTLVRGMTFTGPPPEISETEAHSGKRSMVVKGTLWPNLPQLVIKPNAKYRLSAWVKVVGEGAEAYLTARFYQWSPHAEKWEQGFTSEKALAGQDWKELAIPIDSPKWGPFLDFKIVCDKGTAYVDDFALVEVKP